MYQFNVAGVNHGFDLELDQRHSQALPDSEVKHDVQLGQFSTQRWPTIASQERTKLTTKNRSVFWYDTIDALMYSDKVQGQYTPNIIVRSCDLHSSMHCNINNIIIKILKIMFYCSH
jgi:hypothetical protein